MMAAVFAACSKNDDNNTPPPTPGTTDMTAANISRTTDNSEFKELAGDTLKANITSNTVLKAGKTYILKNFVFVLNGATLKIEAGVTIKGMKTDKGTIIITRNGKIDAQGTADKPIVFTSNQDAPNRGDWGGIIILGNAPTNGLYNATRGLMAIEGGVNTTATGYGLHGGNKAEDNSGTLKYVRIEYAGIAFEQNNEINGLTFGSVGSGTTVDYVEVAYSGDDSFEWFGGTVNCNHLISYRATDDDFDTDNGFSGRVQFGIALRDHNVADFASGGASNGFESDNDADGSSNAPFTSAVFSNMTIIGPAANGTPVAPFKRGAHIRKNSRLSVFNSVFTAWPVGIFVDGVASEANATSNALEAKNNILADCVTPVAAGTKDFDAPKWFSTAAFSNKITVTLLDLKLTNVAYGTFDPTPAAGSALLSGADFSNAKLANFSKTTYVGAASGTDTWYKGWTKF